MKEFLDACFDANWQIYKYLNNIPQEDLGFCSKLGYDNNQAYKLDLNCEKIFIKYLSHLGQIFSEESGFIGKTHPTQIILDPLDGSSNFVSKIPFYGTSIALIKQNQEKSAFVCNLITQEIFAFSNNQALKSKLSNPRYLALKPYPFSKIGIVEKIALYPEILSFLSKNQLKFRSLGATALSLAYASYFSFVLICGKTRIFDTEAALIINQNLHLEKNENFTLLSQDKKIFDIILGFLKNN
ncbi:inositol monophosphatase [Campylobacter sp. VicNov18]|uniref:inositol monophosphatase family protein n=1 Tax=Campylobacter bilis TaxID=2691918 RepID=UPI00130DE9D6|nr:inositol monophosphatase family protein [Campylobacter bilis]MPV63019.1 inositol monophosphatase [Campylobacter hepaticus]MBM0636518.1 inositol monophosphatase [Campylobacter bilis]MCC8277228.1 inositol monophosphatase [Campylobacter bilis]MCC8298971.1 inositol monophosphatase [Campylobacter bilis]MCC8300137.1 inositol monophosphatase [Campylobacter bilis]